MTLRVADSLPIGHIIIDTTTKPWIELVGKLSGGAIEIQYFPAEQLGKAKELLQVTQSGLVDVGYVGPSYIPTRCRSRRSPSCPAPPPPPAGS